MMKLYCHRNHKTKNGMLCAECTSLLTYAFQRIEKCMFLPDKPTCRNCTVHCYSNKNKEAIRNVMRYAGPKMMLRFPGLTTLHLIDGWKDNKRQEKFFTSKK